MQELTSKNLTFFEFTWWDGDSNVNTETFLTDAPKEVIRNSISEIKDENPDEFCYYDIVERIEAKGYKVQSVNVEEFEI